MSITSREPVTVAIAQFEDILGRGLQSLLEEDPGVVLTASDIPPADLPEVLASAPPEVAILNLASLSSPGELRQLHAALPDVRLIVLADAPTPAESRQLVGFGATACLAKTTEARDVLHAIDLASRGLQVLPAADTATPETGDAVPLTAREADVLELLQGGISNAEIAAALHVGVETVRTHARNIYRKLGVRNRRELRLTV